MALNNKLVQIGLIFLAFYVIMQIMNKNVSQENMDTLVTVSPQSGAVDVQQSMLSPTQVSVSQNPPNTIVKIETPSLSNALTAGQPSAANALVTPELAGSTGSASAKPIVTAAPSAAISGGNIPSALTSVEETLLAAAPPTLPNEITTAKPNQNIFAPEPTDLDEMFGRRSTLDPAELIPKTQDAELYGGLKPDPKLNQNFLQNRWSAGIQTSSNSKGRVINDLRGVLTVPFSVVSPFNQTTQFPDLYRKSLADIT